MVGGAPLRELRELRVDAELPIDQVEFVEDIPVRGDPAPAELPGRELLEEARGVVAEVRLAHLDAHLLDDAAALEEVGLALREFGGVAVVGGEVGARLLAFDGDRAGRARVAGGRAERGDGARIVGVVDPSERVEAVAMEGARHLERDGAAADGAEPGEGEVLELEVSGGFGHDGGVGLRGDRWRRVEVREGRRVPEDVRRLLEKTRAQGWSMRARRDVGGNGRSGGGAPVQRLSRVSGT